METFLKINESKVNIRFIVKIEKERLVDNPIIIFTIQEGRGTRERHVVYTDTKKRDEDFDSIPCVTIGETL
jgi:hypothetical protein